MAKDWRGALSSLRRLLLLCLTSLLHYKSVHAQDLAIYGKFSSYLNKIDAKELSYITTKCFQGMLFSTCRPTNVPSDFFAQSLLLPYYVKFASLYGTVYCLECCGNEPSHVDTWDLACDLDSGSLPITAGPPGFGQELRLASHQYAGDKSVVTCPLKRTGCAYDGKTTLNCDGQANVTGKIFLKGYTLTLTVQQLDENFNYWRGVTNCDIVAEESNTPLSPGDSFRETIIMIHEPDPANSKPDAGKTFVGLFTGYFLIYVTLYYFRRNLCVYCQGKLVFSKELCVRCKFVGAKPPDPFLLQALEEKGAHLQGELPERFPGSREFVRRVLACYAVVKDCVVSLRPEKKGVHPQAEGEGGGGGEEAQDSSKPSDKKGKGFKYPKWLKWFKKWRERRLKQQQEDAINPNILEFPKHIIFGAVGHHEPPPPDEEFVANRKKEIIEGLGFDPEAYNDDDDDAGMGVEGADAVVDAGAQDENAAVDGETKTDQAKPAWQKTKRKVQPIADAPRVSWLQQWRLRRVFRKSRNKGPPINKRFALPFCCAITCFSGIFTVFVLFILGLLDYNLVISSF